MYAQYSRVIRAAGESDLPLENIMIRVFTLALLLSISAFCQDKVCNQSAPISISASGSTQIVGPQAPAAIQVCSISLASSAATDLTLNYGSGASCGTGTTAVSGTYKAVTTFSLLWGANTGPVIPMGKSFCINSSAVVTAGGLITFRAY